ncbi:MAG: hypothetical protein MJ086_01705 [Lachnospiraceae bacterium]|nr:hypothetical protein [Lachnospiraceae bacterium]
MVSSLGFYALASGGFLVFVLVEALLIFAFTKVFETKKSKGLFILELVLIFGIVVVLKYAGWFGQGFASLLGQLNFAGKTAGSSLNYIVPLGISYYSISGISYSIDVFRDKYPAENNFAKVLTFISFFPVLTQGPINRYDELSKQLFTYHKFQYENLTYGILRMIWGFFKKLVVAERLSAVVGTLTTGWQENLYSGGWIVLAVALCSLNLYMDFSGCMDIVLGAAEILGIRLPENFDHPYLSKSIPEFWRRWHITLGAWLRDYVMYSFITSKPAKLLNKKAKDKIGRKGASVLVTCIGVLLVWIVYGVWHGLEMKYIISGLYYALIIIVATVLDGPIKKFDSRFPKLVASKAYGVFCAARTYFLAMIGAFFFFMPTIKEGMAYLGNIFKKPVQGLISIPETGIEKVTDIKLLGVDLLDFVVILLGVILWIVLATLHKKKDIRDRLSDMNIVLRWLILLVMLLVVIIVGNYGGNLEAGSFIYQGF